MSQKQEIPMENVLILQIKVISMGPPPVSVIALTDKNDTSANDDRIDLLTNKVGDQNNLYVKTRDETKTLRLTGVTADSTWHQLKWTISTNTTPYVRAFVNGSLIGDIPFSGANATGISSSTTISSSLSSTVGVGDLIIARFNNANLDITKAIFEIQAKNNLESNITNVNWSLTTGNGDIINSTQQFSYVKPNETVFVFVNYDYGASGTFSPTATVTNQTYSDSKTITLNIKHIEAYNLSVVNESGSKRIFEFIIKNSLNTNLTGINWTFDTKNSNVINSTINSVLQPSEQMYVYIDYNFTTTGTYNVNATARNGSLIDYRNLTITI